MIKYTFIIFLILLMGCQHENKTVGKGQSKKINYSGTWSINEKGNFVFYIYIRQVNRNIYGNYCGYPKDMSKVDCNSGDREGDSLKYNIFGKVVNDTAFLSFISSYSGDTGLAKMFIQDSILFWKVTKDPHLRTGNWNGALLEARLFKDVDTVSSENLNFENNWSFSSGSDYFSTLIIQEGSRLRGYYTSEIGEKNYCSLGNDTTTCALSGSIKNDTAFVTFKSCKTGDKGKAVLFLKKNGILHWHTTFNPHTFESKDWNGVRNDYDLKGSK